MEHDRSSKDSTAYVLQAKSLPFSVRKSSFSQYIYIFFHHIGSSGAGKSTLLNALCKRLSTDNKCVLSGSVLANNIPYNHTEFTQFANYVMQDDLLMEFLTVKECITFAANLKIHGTEEEKQAIVHDTIKQLKLEHC